MSIHPVTVPKVVGALLDSGRSAEIVSTLLSLPGVRANVPVNLVIDEVERRDKLRILLPWLEQCKNDGVKVSDVHNSLMKSALA